MSLALEVGARGRGVGAAATELALAVPTPTATLGWRAVVRADNYASRGSFRKAGFEEVGTTPEDPGFICLELRRGA